MGRSGHVCLRRNCEDVLSGLFRPDSLIGLRCRAGAQTMEDDLRKRVNVKRHLGVASLAVLGVLVWAGAASAATELALCIKNADGTVRSSATCKANETQFKVVSAADYAALQQRVTTLEGKVGVLEGKATTLEGKVGTLEGKVGALETLLAGVTRPNPGTLLFTGMNLQVVNGSGQTEETNGLGNIIVGYNEDEGDTRTGSHNVVIGGHHTWTSHSGFVSGWNNTLTGYASFVGGGQLNTASGWGSFVGGTAESTASGPSSFVGGGSSNTASGQGSFVGGGFQSTASGFGSFAGGATDGTASGDRSFVGGGYTNTASGNRSFVGGGTLNTAGGGLFGCTIVLGTLFGTC
jgi:hypothetical protein